MKRRAKYYIGEKLREDKMFFNTQINVRIDLRKIALFLFVKSNNISDSCLDWIDWTPAQVLKKLKQELYFYGSDYLDTEDSDNDKEYMWSEQPDFIHTWFFDQAASLFPEIDWNARKEIIERI